MATFNSMATPASGDGLGLNMNTGAPIGMDAFDADMSFDDSLLDSVQGIPGLPYTPTYDFETFSNTFEDPFAYPSRPNFAVASDNPGGLPGGVGGAPAVAGPIHGHVGHGHTHGHGHGHGGHGIGHRHPAADADAGFADQESSPQDEELDNKLLSFSAPVSKATLVDENGQFVEPGMTAELYGMFFVAEDVFGADTNPGSRPLELTCYRRNLWQCSGQITLPRHNLLHILTDQGVQEPIVELAASITAIESIEGKPTEIISIPWKSANPAAAAAAAGNNGATVVVGGDDHHKAATAPARHPLDLAAGGQELDGSGRVSLPVSWRRLQFKHATANNGRRKGLQQHYVVQITLLAKTKSNNNNSSSSSTANSFIKVAEIRSGPVIVRGRSPRNFDSQKNVALSSSNAAAGEKKAAERRSTTVSLNDAAAPAAPMAVSAMSIKTDPSAMKSEMPQNMQMYQSLGGIQQTTDWTQTFNTGPNPNNPQQQPPPSKKIALSSPTLNRPPVPSWSSSSSSSLQQQPPTPTKGTSAPPHRTPSIGAAPPSNTLPINLSLSEDERSPPNRANSESLASPQFGTGAGAAGGSGGRTLSTSEAAGRNPVTGSPLEKADLLYEYFPLTVDDWMPPVDAIYRPHVVHHTIVPPEIKAQQMRTKAKRYFTAD